jgi:hypothetical protein
MSCLWGHEREASGAQRTLRYHNIKYQLITEAEEATVLDLKFRSDPGTNRKNRTPGLPSRNGGTGVKSGRSWARYSKVGGSGRSMAYLPDRKML